jgi:hypothetical protein
MYVIALFDARHDMLPWTSQGAWRSPQRRIKEPASSGDVEDAVGIAARCT